MLVKKKTMMLRDHAPRKGERQEGAALGTSAGLKCQFWTSKKAVLPFRGQGEHHGLLGEEKAVWQEEGKAGSY